MLWGDFVLMANMTFNEELAVRGDTMVWSAIIWGIVICLVFVLGLLIYGRKS